MNTLTARQIKDHDRYMRDRERRLERQREWDRAHPDYHRLHYQKCVFAELERQKRLKELSERIWNYQVQTSTS